MKYVTYLVTYVGDRLPKYYIGSTSENKVNSGKYFGSVASIKYKDIFKEERKNNPDLFTIEILSLHTTREEAIEKELEFQIKYNVVKSTDYMNESLARVNGFLVEIHQVRVIQNLETNYQMKQRKGYQIH